jgi:hypothetical protein
MNVFLVINIPFTFIYICYACIKGEVRGCTKAWWVLTTHIPGSSAATRAYVTEKQGTYDLCGGVYMIYIIIMFMFMLCYVHYYLG